MKKKYIYLTALIFSASIYTSCQKDKLNPVPQTSITAETSFATPARISNQVLSLYSSLKNGSFYGGRVVIYGDIRGEDFINETGNLVTASDVWSLNLTNSSTSVKSLWSQAYLTINRCNVFLDGMAAGGTTTVGNTTTSNAYLGEARLIRALSYYSLLQFYARPYADKNGANPGIPLRLKGNTGGENYDQAKATVAEVYTQILNDLNFAETNLPVTNSSAYNNTTRAHRNTVIALKTRVYLSMQKYAEVITEANKMVSATAPFTATTGVANALTTDIVSVFRAAYTTPESIFSMPMTNVAGDYPGTQNQLGYYFYSNSTTVGATEFSLNQTGIIANTGWKTTDKRRSFVVAGGTTALASKRFLAKYISPAANNFLDYVPVIRYTEVLLNLAEARARVASASAVPDVQALALLNAVRNRSDATTTFAPLTNTDLINLILTERRIEFLGEGLRNNDLMRLVQTIPVKGSAPQKSLGETGYIWPISSDELSLNKLIGGDNN
ncbi:MAG: RagB/SusD family nutrient uptake outer membrane protein [Sphingobacteriaceae bacterium]|nr:MAG: RagB/SusD family nutrient uptake outer membrane protein [Sphingobacteriaceae bacterium]